MSERAAASVRGVVQGVGFRPVVARLARSMALAGFVRNTAEGAEIEIEGEPEVLARFRARLRQCLPPAARIDTVRWRAVEPCGATDFAIEASGEGKATLSIPPDLAVCPDCLAETLEPAARRHDYPFTNCTRCGPRFTIAAGGPYDRERTSMAPFRMCSECAREFGDPNDRRYHAQPIACPACGPTLRLCESASDIVATGAGALAEAVTALRRGRIVALKGLGGYQLLVRADDAGAVDRLRARKRRPAKPLAVMVADVEAARALAAISDDEVRALQHSAAPIVLVRRRGRGVAASVAPGQHRLGLLLPATPLHALIARRLGVPLVCTSGNLHDEPICIADRDAFDRLAGIADVFACHDREVVRRADDSVVHVVGGRIRTLRLGRGLGPVSVPLAHDGPPVLALGGHFKNAPVLAFGRQAVLWPHVGDLDSPLARDAHIAALDDMQQLAGVRAPALAVDRHPDYATTAWAEADGRPVVRVQHHLAHVASVMAEHRVDAALGFAWDGVGLGDDGTAWGGEALWVNAGAAKRVGHWRPFPLIGGDAAARDGRRVLAGLCATAGLGLPGGDPRLARYAALAGSRRLAPLSSSVGRLFDAVAALTGIATESRFEGEAAMVLEAIASAGAAPYPFVIEGGAIDWAPMLAAMLRERHDAPRVASRFHATVVAALVEMACECQRAMATQFPAVVLSGGCFHNALLLAAATSALQERGFAVLAPWRVPAGDGGLALGQASVARSRSSQCA